MEENIKKKLARNWFLTIQELICHEIENIENGSSYFETKVWSRSDTKDEGGGKSKLLKNGNVFEKVGVNFSEVYGNFSNEFKKKISSKLKIGKEEKTQMKVEVNSEY